MVAKDRLAELQKHQKGKIGLPETVLIVRQDATDKFLEKAENVLQSIDLLETKVAATKELHGRILNSTTVSQQEEDDLKRVMKEITLISTNIRNDMQGIQKDVDKSGLSVTDFRIRKTQHSGLARRVVAVMADYNTAQAEHRQRLKARMKRQLEIANLDGKPKTDDEIESLLETENPQVFSQGIIANSQKAKDALADIEARHQDILALERNVREVRDLFFEVANLVDSQGVTMDRIEDNIRVATGVVADANAQTADALRKQRKARKVKLCLIVTFVIVVAIVIIVLAVQFG